MPLFDSQLYYVQALCLSFAKRLQDSHDLALLLNYQPTGRQAKRAAQQINYSEDLVDDFDEDYTPNVEESSVTVNHFHNQPPPQYTVARPNPHFELLEDEATLSFLAHTPEVLVPIKVSCEHPNGTNKLQDFFMWNTATLHLVSPQQFALILVNDVELPGSMELQIADQITQQLAEWEFASNLTLPLAPGEPYVVVIELTVNLNKQLYQDKLEWDINQTEITPETYATTVCGDLGLPREFVPAIAHALHEQILKVKREVADGTHNLTLNQLQLLRGVVLKEGMRIIPPEALAEFDAWEPRVELLTQAQIERRELEKGRNLRRLKRENLKRGGLEFDDFASKRRATGRRLDW